MFMNECDNSLQQNDRKLRLALIPAGDEETASSRIRIYGMLPWLRKAGVVFTMGPDPQANVIYVQKKLTPELIGNIRSSRNAGTAIIYDIDDLGSALSYWAAPELVDEMIPLAHMVTVDTHHRKALLQAKYPLAPIEVFPPLIDYSPSNPQPIADLRNDEIRVLWFGSMSNFSLFSAYAEALADCATVKTVIITGETYLSEASQQFPNIEFIAWNRATFADSLRTCHLSCLMHDGREADRSKSNNRMITSITWGVPALVSDTPEYSVMARTCGVPEAIFSGPDDVERVIRTFRTRPARQKYLRKAQLLIWKSYAPETITAKFIKLCQRIVGELRGDEDIRYA